MKKRNPLSVFFLSIITLGIYDLYWLVQTKKVLNESTTHHTPSIWLLVAPVPLIILGYIGLLISIPASTTTTYGTTGISNATNTHTTHPTILIIALAVMIIGWIASFAISIIWFYKFSKAVNEYTQSKMSTAVAFLVLWLIHLIGVALIQDAFNDMQDSPRPYNNQPPPAMVGSDPQPIVQQPINPLVVSPQTVVPSPPPQPPSQTIVSPNQQTDQSNSPYQT